MYAIRAPHAFDGDTFRAGGATVFVDGGRIAGIEPAAYGVPDDCPLIDHGDATILPGLIETHAHLVTDSGPMALDRVASYSAEEIDAVVAAALERQLASGVTTVRDLGDRGFNVVARRDAQRANDDGLPWIVASGPPITTPGGHCWYLRGEVEGTAQIQAAIDERIRRGVDAVKIMASGGMNTAGSDVSKPQFPLDVLRLMVDRAHAAGLPVAMHAHAAAAVDQAASLGVETIEHATFITRGDPALGFLGAMVNVEASDQQLEDLARSGATVCPTLGGFSPQMFEHSPPAVRQLVAESEFTPEQVVAIRIDLLTRMRDAGVRFVSGSDAGITPTKAHGAYATAVTHLGEVLDAAGALTSATRTAAEVCGLSATKGRLSPGYDADLLVVGGDLSVDLAGLPDVRQVVLRGRHAA